MQPIRRILAPTDLSQHSCTGIRYALEMAAAQAASVLVFYVAHYEEAVPYAFGLDEGASMQMPASDVWQQLEHRREALHELLTANFADLLQQVAVQEEVDIGIAYEKIVDKAKAAQVDMIVMSTHGRTGLEHMLIGSITEQVVRRASCPVLSIRPST